MRYSFLVVIVYAGLLFLTYYTFQRAPTGFIPQQDQGRLIANIQLPDSASLQRTQAIAAQVVKIAKETDGVAHTVCFAGISFLLQSTGPNFASLFIILDPFEKRQKPHLRDTEIMARLKKRWAAEIRDAKTTVYGASPIPGLGTAGGFKLVVEDRGDLGLPTLEKQTEKLVSEIQKLPGLSSVATLFRSNTPQLFFDIDRDKAATLGVSLQDVNQTLAIYLGSLYVNSFSDFGRHWQVTVQAEGDYRDRTEAVSLFQVRNKAGQMVPLGTIVTVREMGGPIAVSRYNLYRGAAINGNVLTGYSTGDVIKAIEALSRDTLPRSMRIEWTDLMFMQLRAGNTAMIVFMLSVICVFLALAALYESWALPLAVILVVPLCLLCSVAGVLYSNRDVNIFVQIGLVVLVGLACKNAILIVEFAKQLHQEGQSVYEATKQASSLRLRPILMTSFAFILGVVPLVVASGAGAEMRRSLGTAVFSGMLGVTLFGIFLTPVFFFVIERLSETSLFATAQVRWFGSCIVGGTLGAAIAYALISLGVFNYHLYGAMGAGAGAGILLMLSILEIYRRIRK